jgi:hypothetical protein
MPSLPRRPLLTYEPEAKGKVVAFSKRCAHCGEINYERQAECAHCGASLFEEEIDDAAQRIRQRDQGDGGVELIRLPHRGNWFLIGLEKVLQAGQMAFMGIITAIVWILTFMYM